MKKFKFELKIGEQVIMKENVIAKNEATVRETIYAKTIHYNDEVIIVNIQEMK